MKKEITRENKEKKWVELRKAEGLICAGDCGLFPPCTPLIRAGEKITGEKVDLLLRAANLYGIIDGKILVETEEEKDD